MEGNATHLVPIIKAVLKLGGPVLELGSGFYSTPILHAICDDVLTVETDGMWANILSQWTGPKMRLVESIPAYLKTIDITRFKVAFIDCSIAGDRLKAVELLKDCPCLVAHDTEADYWQESLRTFKYVKHWTQMMPYTSYLSNVLDVQTI